MAAQINSIRMGLDNVYVVKETGTIVVDGGAPGKFAAFVPGLQSLLVSPGDVKLVVLTHGHWDHIGCASAIREVTGAPIAMHQAERERIERPCKSMPPGTTAWGKILGGFCSLAIVPFQRIPPAHVDIAVSDEGMSLEPFGVGGKILHTPGHSPGSLSVLLDSGDAFVGDLAMNTFLVRVGPCLPLFAEDLPRLGPSMSKIISHGAKRIHPAHGPSFPVELLEEAVQLLSKGRWKLAGQFRNLRPR
jgi:glyoxylase-like metal-dependent hydrolase (beta-lactamase superfamily II)